MKVKIFATLRQVAGTKETDIEVAPGETVGDLLKRLVERYPKLKGRLFDEAGELQKSIHVFIRGRDIRLKEGLDTVIEEGDELALFPPVAGGT